MSHSVWLIMMTSFRSNIQIKKNMILVINFRYFRLHCHVIKASWDVLLVVERNRAIREFQFHLLIPLIHRKLFKYHSKELRRPRIQLPETFLSLIKIHFRLIETNTGSNFQNDFATMSHRMILIQILEINVRDSLLRFGNENNQPGG